MIVLSQPDEGWDDRHVSQGLAWWLFNMFHYSLGCVTGTCSFWRIPPICGETCDPSLICCFGPGMALLSKGLVTNAAFVLLRPTTGDMNIPEMVVTEATGLGGHTVVFAASVSSTGQAHHGYRAPVLLGCYGEFLGHCSQVPSSDPTFWQSGHAVRYVLSYTMHESLFSLHRLEWKLLSNWENRWIWWTFTIMMVKWDIMHKALAQGFL